jgi:flagellar hook-associated protein FlgK
MATISSTANSALQAWQQSLNVTAQNVSNINNAQYQPQRPVFQEEQGGGVSLQVQPTGNDVVSLNEEVVRLSVITQGFRATLKAVKTQDEMTGSILNRRF